MEGTDKNMSGSRFKEMSWDQAVDRVQPTVFQVYAESHAGTGFIVSLGQNAESAEAYVVVATARHVISELPGTSGDIRLVSADGSTVFSSATHEMGFHPHWQSEA